MTSALWPIAFKLRGGDGGKGRQITAATPGRTNPQEAVKTRKRRIQTHRQTRATSRLENYGHP